MSTPVRVRWENDGKIHTGIFGLLSETDETAIERRMSVDGVNHIRFVDGDGHYFGIESNAIISIHSVPQRAKVNMSTKPKEKK